MLIYAPGPVDLAELPLHLREPETHLNQLGALGALKETSLDRSLEQLPRATHPVVLRRLGYLQVYNLVALLL
jgi:hypothetical protein